MGFTLHLIPVIHMMEYTDTYIELVGSVSSKSKKKARDEEHAENSKLWPTVLRVSMIFLIVIATSLNNDIAGFTILALVCICQAFLHYVIPGFIH